MQVSNVFRLEVKNILKKQWLYFSLIISVLLASALVYAIKFMQGPFTIKAISGFYGIGSTIALAIFCTKLYLDDLGSGTITLFFSSQKNRKTYLVGKLLAALLLGFLFGGVCALVLLISSAYLGWEIKLLEFIIEPILIYILFSLFYMLLFFLIGIFERNTNNLIIITIITVLAIPSVVERINLEKASVIVREIINHVPIFFMVQGTKYLQLSSDKLIILSSLIVVLFMTCYYLIGKANY